jgi:hypothetical protein
MVIIFSNVKSTHIVSYDISKYHKKFAKLKHQKLLVHLIANMFSITNKQHLHCFSKFPHK